MIKWMTTTKISSAGKLRINRPPGPLFRARSRRRADVAAGNFDCPRKLMLAFWTNMVQLPDAFGRIAPGDFDIEVPKE